MEDPVEGDPPNLAPLISVAHKSSLISPIAQTFNTVRLAVWKQIAWKEKKRKIKDIRKKTKKKKNSCQVGVNERNQKKGGWSCAQNSQTIRVLRRVSYSGYRTWPCLRFVEPGIPTLCIAANTWCFTSQESASLLFPLLFAICVTANLLPFCSAFCQLTACLFSIHTHSFSDCSLGNCHFLSFPAWNNFLIWILLLQLVGKTISVCINVYLLFCSSYVYQWFRYYC